MRGESVCMQGMGEVKNGNLEWRLPQGGWGCQMCGHTIYGKGFHFWESRFVEVLGGPTWYFYLLVE